jgi:hypothetical protein
MSAPDHVWPPPQPPIQPRGTDPPFIVDQRPGPGNTVRVTWSLPGLVRAVILIPQREWLAGEHAGIGRAAADVMRSLTPEQMPDDDTDSITDE